MISGVLVTAAEVEADPMFERAVEEGLRRAMARRCGPPREAPDPEFAPPPPPAVPTVVEVALRDAGLDGSPIPVRVERTDAGRMRAGWSAAADGVTSAVYVLCDGDAVMYVGQTKHARSRLADHAGVRRFSAAFVAPCPPERLDEVERRLIARLAPAWNIHGRGRRWSW